MDKKKRPRGLIHFQLMLFTWYEIALLIFLISGSHVAPEAFSTWPYMNFTFMNSKTLSQTDFNFWLLKIPTAGENKAVNKVAWYVNESCSIYLSSIVPRSTHVRTRVTNQNEIHCHRVYKIISDTSIITIEIRFKKSTLCVILKHFRHVLNITKSVVVF